MSEDNATWHVSTLLEILAVDCGGHRPAPLADMVSTLLEILGGQPVQRQQRNERLHVSTLLEILGI